MSVTSINEIKVDTFAAHWERQGAAVVVWMKGNADMAVHERLKTFLDAVDLSVKASQAKEAVFELEDLYFMNSSCLSLLLRFINGILGLRASERYKVRFRSNPNLRWQKKSLAALKAYAQDLVTID
ncbi:MAG TPA: hypothetical protein VKU41_13620 [Polyangiaceae bacterium]|nr:hypothetical protein [Polyangiaceae bacterium]